MSRKTAAITPEREKFLYEFYKGIGLDECQRSEFKFDYEFGNTPPARSKGIITILSGSTSPLTLEHQRAELE